MKAKLANFIALDLGSSKIAGFAAYVDKRGDARVLSQHIRYSSGFRSGVITNLKAAENSILELIYELEKDCGRNIKEVNVSLSGSGTKSYYISHKIKLSNQPITKQDVNKLVQKALLGFKLKDQDIIHYFPIEYSVDDNKSIDNPIGMFGKELECRLHVITANSMLMQNLTNCFACCQIEIDSVSLAIYADGLACLSEDEKNLGSIIIDIGARATAFGIFLGGKCIYTGHVPLGSWHITSDIAKIFSINFMAAEKLKVLYGNASPSIFDSNNAINIDELDSDNVNEIIMPITTKQLTDVIHARVEEIINSVKNQYDKVGVDHLISRRLVITGGGSMLRGLKEVASKIFDKQVRVGYPTILPGVSQDYNPAIYSTVIGIIKSHSQKQQKKSFEVGNEETTLTKKIFSWLKENI